MRSPLLPRLHDELYSAGMDPMIRDNVLGVTTAAGTWTVRIATQRDEADIHVCQDARPGLPLPTLPGRVIECERNDLPAALRQLAGEIIKSSFLPPTKGGQNFGTL